MLEQLREDEIIILIGAGCSADAGIPTSEEMTNRLEEFVKKERKEFETLYTYIKSAIIFQEHLLGNSNAGIDIERIVNVLNEIEHHTENLLYPFIGSWHPRFQEIINSDLKNLRDFKENLSRQAKNWVQLDDYRKANYYRRFFDLQKEYQYSLRIFSLNFDLCFERNTPNGKKLERGFDPDNRKWDWRRFEPNENYQPEIYLYKIHGSIDWIRDEEHGDSVKEVDTIQDNPEFVFGTTTKLRSVDPYLFSVFELRKYCLEAKVILAIGYGFRDQYINDIFIQALKQKEDIAILIVSPNAKELAKVLGNVHNQCRCVNEGAKSFLEGISIKKIVDIYNNKAKYSCF
jgi:hypothetical protein